jgi:hypothetical protein
MPRQAARLCALLSGLAGLAGLMLGTACGGDTIVRTTIDVRCSSNAECPTGFQCWSESEHGPPTTLCESQDPAVTCPPGYDSKLLYGQTLCKPPPGTSAAREPRGAMSVIEGGARASRGAVRGHGAR